MKFLFVLEQIRIQVVKYSELWSLNVYQVHPYVPSLTTPPPSPYNHGQNKHGLHRCRFLYLRAVQRVLKTHWDSRRLDWTRLGRCEHPLTLESDWTGLNSTRLCWCVHTLRDLLYAKNLRHGTDGFTSPPKEGVLRIFSSLKIRRLRPVLNPCYVKKGLRKWAILYHSWGTWRSVRLPRNSRICKRVLDKCNLSLSLSLYGSSVRGT